MTKYSISPTVQGAFASLTKIALTLAGAAVLGTSLAVAAQAQSYPERPVSLIVPYPAGGAIDASARRLADFLTHELGQPVLVENRSGANSIVGTGYVARSAPDGYTILYTTLVAQAGNLFDYDDLPYDTHADFKSVSVIQAPPNVLVAHPSFEPNTVDELVALAKENPGDITFGTNGPGSPAHLRGVQIINSGEIDLALIAYQGGAAAMTDLVGGHIDLYPSQLSLAVPFLQQDQLKVLAVLGTERLESMPDVPSIRETPGFENYEELATFPLILVPSGTPDEIVDQLHTAVANVIDNEQFREVSRSMGEYEPFALTPEETDARLLDYIALLEELI